MIGRIGDEVFHEVLRRCEGCCATTLDCQVAMDEDRERCCFCCTHIHDGALLKRYGLLER